MGTPKLPSWKEKHSLISNPLAKVPTVLEEGHRNINMPGNRESGCTNWTISASMYITFKEGSTGKVVKILL